MTWYTSWQTFKLAGELTKPPSNGTLNLCVINFQFFYGDKLTKRLWIESKYLWVNLPNLTVAFWIFATVLIFTSKLFYLADKFTTLLRRCESYATKCVCQIKYRNAERDTLHHLQARQAKTKRITSTFCNCCCCCCSCCLLYLIHKYWNLIHPCLMQFFL